MSYKGDDKWEGYFSGMSVHSSNYKDFKNQILKELKKCYINQATNQYDTIEYEITKITIKKKKEKEILEI